MENPIEYAQNLFRIRNLVLFKKATKYFPKHPYFTDQFEIDKKLTFELTKFKTFGIGNNNLDPNLIFYWLSSKYFVLEERLYKISDFVKDIGINIFIYEQN